MLFPHEVWGIKCIPWDIKLVNTVVAVGDERCWTGRSLWSRVFCQLSKNIAIFQTPEEMTRWISFAKKKKKERNDTQ